MMRNSHNSLLAAVLALACAPMAGWGSAAAQAAKPQPAQQQTEQEQKKGTGVVPPGIKLVTEMPPGAPPRSYPFPKAAEQTLPNGLHVFVVSDHRLPAVSVRLVLPAAGAIHDPAGLPGVASMTANMLTQGTEKRSAQQIAEAIDFVGGSISASADGDGTYVTATVVNRDLNLALDLLSDVVLHPAFQQQELDRQQQQLLSSLRLQYSDPNYLASASISRIVYGPSPYGIPDQGTPESAEKLVRDALVRFHDAYYAPNQALLAFAGDITVDAAFAAAGKYLGGWPQKDLPAEPVAAPQPTQGLHFYVIDKPDAVQTQIRAGRLGIPRNSPDYIPLLVTNRIFGGGYNSRLNTEVRIRKGLTYGASSVFNSHKSAGIFAAGTFTRTEATVEATQLVLELIAKMAGGTVTAEEMNFARDYLAGVYPIETETAEQAADRVVAAAEFGLPADYNSTYQQKILGVAPEQVKAMAGRYFDAQDMDVVLVGNASQFRDALKKAFPAAPIEEIPIDQVDLLSVDLRRPKEVVAAATPESLARGKQILEAAAEAAGGSAALEKIESLEVSSTGQLFTPQGGLPIEIKLQLAYPDHLLNQVKLPFGLLETGYDGKAAWASTPQGLMELPVNLNAEAQRAVDLASGVGLWRQVLAGKVMAQFLGEEEFEGKKALAVQWTAASGPVKLFFDPVTHLLAGARYKSTTPQGVSEAMQTWDDYRPVEGVKIPYHMVNYRDGAKFIEATTKEVKLNTKPDPAVFSKPH
jgi:zinc protease